MAKSKFKALRLRQDGKLVVEGETPTPTPPTHLHVAVVQGDRVFRRDRVEGHATWEFSGDANGIEADKDAQALGLAIELNREDNSVAFETFVWMQTLTVSRT